MGLCFLWSNVADEVCVGYFAVFGDLGLVDEENGAGSCYFVGAGAIFSDSVGEEATPFIGESAFPDLCFWASEEFLEGTLFSGDGRGSGQCSDVVSVTVGYGGLC